MTKTEQLKAGLLAMGAKPVATASTKHECFSLELGSTARDPASGEVSHILKTWYLFLGRGAGLRIAKQPRVGQSMPVSPGLYNKILSRGTSV